jgi:monofunctional biosynthetic peptidoglycan transglycosylase
LWRRHPLLAASAATILAVGCYGVHVLVSLPGVAHLRRERPQVTSLMKQRQEEARGRGAKQRLVQVWVPLQEMAPALLDAVIVAEDANFYGHRGFDFYEIRESIEKNLERGRFARGASTITQQLAKNLFLSTERTLGRKLKEAILTYRLERDLKKRRILEIYLNVIEWGNGIYGAEAAARAHLGKSCSDLDPAEAALLAALIPGPRRLTQPTQQKALRTRQQRILLWMRQTGRINEEEYLSAREKQPTLRYDSPANGSR